MKKNTLGIIGAMLVAILAVTACSTIAGVFNPSTTSISVKSVTLAGGLDANYQAVNPKTQFLSTDTINVSVDVTGRPTTGTMNGKFYYGDQLISEATLDFSNVNQGVIVSIGGDTFAGFHLTPSQPWPVGTGYHFDLYINGTKLGSYPYQVTQ